MQIIFAEIESTELLTTVKFTGNREMFFLMLFVLENKIRRWNPHLKKKKTNQSNTII